MHLRSWLSAKAILVLLCLILAPLCAFGASGTFTILSDRVKVSAIEDVEGSDPDAGVFMFGLSVEHANDRFGGIFTAIMWVRDRNEAILRLKKTIGWKGDYLFVSSECGGNAVRCNHNHVFAIRKERLLYIGEACGGLDDWREEVGPCYEGGYFTDLYFVHNVLTGYAPGFRVFMRENDGHFQVDLTRTWQGNRAMFDKNAAKIQRLMAKAADNEYFILNELLTNAALAKYCRRKVELQKMIRVAQATLGKETLQTFMDILSEVVPGELPKPFEQVKQL